MKHKTESTKTAKPERIKKATESRAPADSMTPKLPATKAEMVIALLKDPSGATLQAIMTATGWQSHSVRGFISGQLINKRKLRVRSFERDGERVYKIRG